MTYLSKKGDFGDIFVFDLQDSGLFRITKDKYYEECLAWSPDVQSYCLHLLGKNNTVIKNPTKQYLMIYLFMI